MAAAIGTRTGPVGLMITPEPHTMSLWIQNAPYRAAVAVPSPGPTASCTTSGSTRGNPWDQQPPSAPPHTRRAPWRGALTCPTRSGGGGCASSTPPARRSTATRSWSKGPNKAPSGSRPSSSTVWFSAATPIAGSPVTGGTSSPVAETSSAVSSPSTGRSGRPTTDRFRPVTTSTTSTVTRPITLPAISAYADPTNTPVSMPPDVEFMGGRRCNVTTSPVSGTRPPPGTAHRKGGPGIGNTHASSGPERAHTPQATDRRQVDALSGAVQLALEWVPQMEPVPVRWG